ncbi:MAG: diphosphomevalonate decarboxylase [Pseudobacteriovorax sp.]|nr:diphosphomevalonate decarboxylase [Pseudobacteriovorax sp.]
MRSAAIYEAIVPSNIAFIKYWGKKQQELQWPANDSISMTLDSLHSKTRCRFLPTAPDHAVTLNGSYLTRDSGPGAKIYSHLDFLARELNCQDKLEVSSSNSFPTGCGIASSASGLGALTLASIATWFDCSTIDDFRTKDISYDRLIDYARMGSGSACRSLTGGFVQWIKGDHPDHQKVVQLYDQEHWRLNDTVVLFSQKEKAVGSTEAHRLAWSSPLFAPRLAYLPERIQQVKDAIAKQSIKTLGPILEQEALEMHSVIMSANQPVFYINQAASEFLAWLIQRRKEENLSVYFTIDAGPNIHLIYESAQQSRVLELIESYETITDTLTDTVGSGPQLRKFKESSE